MTTIKWVSTTSKFFSDPTAWDSGTVPTASDVAVWDSVGNGGCTLDASITVDGMKFGDYAGTFASAGFSMVIGSQGFDVAYNASVTMTGTIDLGASTITNIGNVDWSGITFTQLKATNATWMQNGGTNALPVLWRRFLSTGNMIFKRIEMNGVINMTGASPSLAGTTNVIRGRVFSTSYTMFGLAIAGAIIELVEGFELDFLAITFPGPVKGYTQGLKPTTTLLLNYSADATGCIFNCFAKIANGSSAREVKVNGAVFHKNTEISSNAALTVTAEGTRFYGDVTSNTTGSIIINGLITFEGLADQTIDTGAISGAVSATFNKPVGNVTVAGASQIALANVSNFGGKLAFASGFSGTFASNGHAMTCGGFDASSAMTGTIDLGASTVTNSGNVNWLGVTDAQFLVTLATWIQRGGALAVPITWTDTSSRSRSFFSLTFDEGSYAKLIGSLTYSSKDIYVNGAIDIATMLQYYNVAVTENGIHIADTGSITGTDFRLYYGKLFGNVSNIKTTGIILRDGFRSAGGDFKSPVTLAAYTTSNASFTSAVKFEKSLTLSRQTTGAFKMTMNATVEGDVIFSGTGTGSYTIVGAVTASGLADQTIDVSAVTSPAGVLIIITKPAGTLTNAVGSKITVVADSTVPVADNFGSITVDQNVTLTVNAYQAHPGSEITGSGTLRTYEIVRV